MCCVQAMLPPPAAAAMESMDMKKAMAILIAMDPNKAADVLTGAMPWGFQLHMAAFTILFVPSSKNFAVCTLSQCLKDL
jgi:hypothetical protein